MSWWMSYTRTYVYVHIHVHVHVSRIMYICCIYAYRMLWHSHSANWTLVLSKMWKPGESSSCGKFLKILFSILYMYVYLDKRHVFIIVWSWELTNLWMICWFKLPIHVCAANILIAEIFGVCTCTCVYFSPPPLKFIFFCPPLTHSLNLSLFLLPSPLLSLPFIHSVVSFARRRRVLWSGLTLVAGLTWCVLSTSQRWCLETIGRWSQLWHQSYQGRDFQRYIYIHVHVPEHSQVVMDHVYYVN